MSRRSRAPRKKRTRRTSAGEEKGAPLALIVLGLTLATAVVYAPVGGFGFVSYDDPQYVSENTRVLRGLSLEGARWALTGVHHGNWHPATTLSCGCSRRTCSARPAASREPGAPRREHAAALLATPCANKLIQTPLRNRTELYRLSDDPHEQRDLLVDPTPADRARADALAAELETWAASAAPLPSEREFEQARETNERLRALGYLVE